MRKIEEKMIRSMKTFTPMKSETTAVKVSKEDPLYCEVFLFGNKIATFCGVSKRLNVYDCGWRCSATVKSRLNAILSEFAPGYHVYQKDKVWYLLTSSDNVHLWNGSAEFIYGNLSAY